VLVLVKPLTLGLLPQVAGARPYTVREYARLQGVPDAFTFAGSDNDAYRMIGNGVSVPVGKWIASEIVRYFQ
jgi:DNA (cytosine-5)-methyltransferase 1